MLFTTDNDIDQVTEDVLEDMLLVFGGQCTCCRLQHKGITRCDKELLVIPVLALYVRASIEKDKSEASRHVYNFIEKHHDQMFPKTFTAEFARDIEDAGVNLIDMLPVPSLLGKPNVNYLSRKKSEQHDPKVDVRVEERVLFGTLLDILPEVLEKMTPILGVQQPVSDILTTSRSEGSAAVVNVFDDNLESHKDGSGVRNREVPEPDRGETVHRKPELVHHKVDL